MNEIEQLSPEQLINTIFEPLSEQDKSLPSRITQYILQGDELDVLVEFDKLCQISDIAYKLHECMCRPCRLYSLLTSVKIEITEQARIEFYRRWTGTFSSEQIIRFARFLLPYVTVYLSLKFLARNYQHGSFIYYMMV